MSDVTFHEESGAQSLANAPRPSFLVRLVLSTGLATAQKDAEYVLIGVAVSSFLLAGAVLFFLSPSDAQPVPQSVIDSKLPAHVRGNNP